MEPLRTTLVPPRSKMGLDQLVAEQRQVTAVCRWTISQEKTHHLLVQERIWIGDSHPQKTGWPGRSYRRVGVSHRSSPARHGKNVSGSQVLPDAGWVGRDGMWWKHLNLEVDCVTVKTDCVGCSSAHTTTTTLLKTTVQPHWHQQCGGFFFQFSHLETNIRLWIHSFTF